MFSFDNETLLRKALQLFLLYGYRKTSMANLAIVMAVSRQKLYSKFYSKKRLFEVLIEAISQQALERGQLELVPNRPVWQAVASALDKWLGASIDELGVSPYGVEIYEAWRTQHTADWPEAGYAEQMCTALSEFLKRAEALGHVELRHVGSSPFSLAKSVVDCAEGIRATSDSAEEFKKKIETLLVVFARATAISA